MLNGSHSQCEMLNWFTFSMGTKTGSHSQCESKIGSHSQWELKTGSHSQS